MNNLAGWHIVVTRPRAQADTWAAHLRELGASTSVAPLLEIVPVSLNAQIQAIKNCILDLDQYDKAIFVSLNAVEHAFDWIEDYWPQLPSQLEFLAVGKTTAMQLQRHGVKVTDLAQTQTGAMTSETLLESPALQTVVDEKIVIFRGVGGRPQIGEVLRSRGAKVNYCELYERLLPLESVPLFASIFAHCLKQSQQVLESQSVSDLQTISECQPGDKLVVMVQSGEALGNLQKILRDLVTEPHSIMASICLVVPSQRILELAEAAGFINVCAAQNATEASMLQGLIDLAARTK